MTPLEAILSRLQTQGVGIPGTNIFAGTTASLPESNAGFLTITETGGLPPVATHNDGLVSLRRPSFQVVARAGDYRVASTLIRAAYEALAFSNTTVGDKFFLTSVPIQEPFSLANDGNGRARLAFNVATFLR